MDKTCVNFSENDLLKIEDISEDISEWLNEICSGRATLIETDDYIIDVLVRANEMFNYILDK